MAFMVGVQPSGDQAVLCHAILPILLTPKNYYSISLPDIVNCHLRSGTAAPRGPLRETQATPILRACPANSGIPALWMRGVFRLSFPL